MAHPITSAKGIGQLVVVAIPTLFMLIWTIDAPLVPGADVFLLALVQLVFIIGFFVYDSWRGGSGQEGADAT